MAHTRKYAGAGQAVIHCAVLAVWCIVGCSRPDAYTQPQSNIDRQDNERSSITVAVAEGVAGWPMRLQGTLRRLGDEEQSVVGLSAVVSPPGDTPRKGLPAWPALVR